MLSRAANCDNLAKPFKPHRADSAEILSRLHMGHQGRGRCKILARGAVFGPNTGWPRKHYPSLSQVAEILLIMTQIGHFATRFLTKSKEMGTIWTSRFEDKSLNFIARYF